MDFIENNEFADEEDFIDRIERILGRVDTVEF